MLQLSGLAQWHWARSPLCLPEGMPPVEKRVATELHTAVKQLLLAPCGNSWIDDAFANYCNVARCLLPMQQYTLETNDNRGEPVLVARRTMRCSWPELGAVRHTFHLPVTRPALKPSPRKRGALVVLTM